MQSITISGRNGYTIYALPSETVGNPAAVRQHIARVLRGLRNSGMGRYYTWFYRG